MREISDRGGFYRRGAILVRSIVLIKPYSIIHNEPEGVPDTAGPLVVIHGVSSKII